MTTRNLFFSVFPSAIIFVACTHGGRAQEVRPSDWKDRFLSTAPAAWAKFASKAARFQGTVTERRFAEPSKKLHSEAIFKIKQSQACASMANYESMDLEARAVVSVANSKYHFKMRRGEKQGSLAVVEISTDPIDKPPPNRPGLDVVGTVRGVARLPIAINFNLADDWPAVVASPDFVITGVLLCAEEGRELLKVDYDLNRSATTENLIRVVGRGSAWFDPTSFWVMKKCVYKMQWGPGGPVKDEQSDFRYKYDKDDFPILEEAVVMYFDGGGKLEARKELTFDLSLADLPEREFTLSAYGFPEPDGVVWPTNNRTWMWLGIGSICCVAVGLYLSKKRRQLAIANAK